MAVLSSPIDHMGWGEIRFEILRSWIVVAFSPVPFHFLGLGRSPKIADAVALRVSHAWDYTGSDVAYL